MDGTGLLSSVVADTITRATALLQFTPQQHRDLRETSVNVDCGEADPLPYQLLIFRCHAYCFSPLPPPWNRFSLVPCISVCTATAIEYENGTDGDYSTEILFHDRVSFKAAYRFARALARDRGHADVASMMACERVYLAPHYAVKLKEAA